VEFQEDTVPQQNFAWEKFAGIYPSKQEMIHPSARNNEQTPTGDDVVLDLGIHR
jgi:hypothetical protein